ncbi:histidine phosphatase family protein, partial [Nocardioides sp. P5_C9_2]
MRLMLLRHGQTVANTTAALDTAAPGHELTELGRRQARAAARALAMAGIGHVAVSTAVRTTQTATPLAEDLGLAPRTYDGLREIAAGDFEMRNDHAAIEGFLGTIGGWLEGDTGRRMPGGETCLEFLARYDAAIGQVCAGGADVSLVVSHGAAIRTWVTHRAAGDHAPVHEGLHNTGCITLDGDPDDGWVVVSWEREPVGGAWLDDTSAPDPTGGDLDAADDELRDRAGDPPAQSSG